MRFNQNVADRYDEVVCKKLHISSIEFRCFDIITQREGVTAGELARDAGISPASVTNVLDHLEERGWIQRYADPRDRRKALIRATEVAGKEIFPFYQELFEHFLGTLSKWSVAELEKQLAFYNEANRFTTDLIERVKAEKS
jgi:DNA-binding MarR family transcriptional regulator